MVSIKYVQFHMVSANWPDQFISCLHHEKMMTASKLQNKSVVKYVNIKTWHRFLVHIIFKVSSINIWIHNYYILLSVFIVSVNMLMITVVTVGEQRI